MNKYILISILFIFTLLVGCGKETPTTNRVTIQLNMEKEAVTKILISLGVKDIGNGMQVSERDPEKLKEWMWHSEDYKFTVETIYSEGKLKTLNYWDWKNRELTSYHHTMEYHELSELTIETNTKQSFTKLIKKHNEKK